MNIICNIYLILLLVDKCKKKGLSIGVLNPKL